MGVSGSGGGLLVVRSAQFLSRDSHSAYTGQKNVFINPRVLRNPPSKRFALLQCCSLYRGAWGFRRILWRELRRMQHPPSIYFAVCFNAWRARHQSGCCSNKTTNRSPLVSSCCISRDSCCVIHYVRDKPPPTFGPSHPKRREDSPTPSEFDFFLAVLYSSFCVCFSHWAPSAVECTHQVQIEGVADPTKLQKCIVRYCGYDGSKSVVHKIFRPS